MAQTVTELELENPLVEGLERLPVHPTSLVIFGATGDLAHRKLLPGALQPRPRGPAARALRDDRRRAPRPGARGLPRRRAGLDSAATRGASRLETCSSGLLDDMRYVQGSFDEDRVYEELGTDAGRVRRAGRPPARPRLLPVDGARVLPADRRQARRCRPQRRSRTPTSDRDREAVRLRPRLGAQAQRTTARGVRGAADLPDRPLPGQGDGPEPDGAAIRQRAVRAGLEPQLHRPRADHRRRGHRDRRACRLLRGRRRAPRPGPEPHAAAAGAAGDGAADGVRRRSPARREAQGARGDRAA